MGGGKDALVQKGMLHCCSLGGVIFLDGVQSTGHCYLFADAAAVFWSFPKSYRLPVVLCNYISLLTSQLSLGFFNP